jgi:putative addiction module component (TIGR02574 family)
VNIETRQLFQHATGLPPMERAALIEALLQSFAAEPDPAQQAAWQADAESRIDAYEAGDLSDDSPSVRNRSRIGTCSVRPSWLAA